MSKEIDDGGSAFPQVDSQYDHDEHRYDGRIYSEGGMSLRDYFAGQALIVLANDVTGGFEWEERTAENAYKLADAMIKARAQATPEAN